MNIKRSVCRSVIAAVLLVASCAQQGAFEKRRGECQRLSVDSERAACVQKVNAEEREYQRKKNETRIEKEYKRRLEERG